MGKYIDREAMLEQIARREPLMVGDKMISIDTLREFIMNRPIADVEEVKHGHWIYYPECGVTKCYELTYNGDKDEMYLDAYKKFENRCIRGEENGRG